MRQQRLHFPAKVRIAVTRLSNEVLALLRLASERLVVQLQHPLAGVDGHRADTGVAPILRHCFHLTIGGGFT